MIGAASEEDQSSSETQPLVVRHDDPEPESTTTTTTTTATSATTSDRGRGAGVSKSAAALDRAACKRLTKFVVATLVMQVVGAVLNGVMVWFTTYSSSMRGRTAFAMVLSLSACHVAYLSFGAVAAARRSRRAVKAFAMGHLGLVLALGVIATLFLTIGGFGFVSKGSDFWLFMALVCGFHFAVVVGLTISYLVQSVRVLRRKKIPRIVTPVLSSVSPVTEPQVVPLAQPVSPLLSGLLPVPGVAPTPGSLHPPDYVPSDPQAETAAEAPKNCAPGDARKSACQANPSKPGCQPGDPAKPACEQPEPVKGPCLPDPSLAGQHFVVPEEPDFLDAADPKKQVCAPDFPDAPESSPAASAPAAAAAVPPNNASAPPLALMPGIEGEHADHPASP